MYGGLRINEVAQLELSDFSEVDGIPVMSINDKGEGKRLKNDNSRRTVPVHPELVRLGLLEHVEEQRKRGAKRLFPDFPQGRYGCGQAASKWFGHLRERLGLQHNFHSLRHTFATKLREADVSKEDIADLLGHSRGEGETAGRYMKAASARRLREALSKLSYAEKPKA
jgi:integrase